MDGGAADPEAHAELNVLFAEADVHGGPQGRGSSTLLDVARPAAIGLVASLPCCASCAAGSLRRPAAAPVEIVADGRADWIGWVELTTEPADELALRHTAMVVRDVGADILGVVEAEDRTTLQRFSDRLLVDVGGTPYEQVMLVDGNDDRGIDVGVLVRAALVIDHIRTHVFDRDDEGVVFSRDCCEYHFRHRRRRLVVLVNHFKSKGYSGRATASAPGAASPGRPCRGDLPGLRDEGIDRVAIVGDLNDTHGQRGRSPRCSPTPTCATSAKHRDSTFGERRGTFEGGNEAAKLDDVLLSPPLFAGATGGADRSAAALGMPCGRRTRGRCTSR